MYKSDVSEQFLVFQLKIAGISDASRTLASDEGKFRTLLHGSKAPEHYHTVMMLLRTNI
jgi:hypothetical protein